VIARWASGEGEGGWQRPLRKLFPSYVIKGASPAAAAAAAAGSRISSASREFFACPPSRDDNRVCAPGQRGLLWEEARKIASTTKARGRRTEISRREFRETTASSVQVTLLLPRPVNNVPPPPRWGGPFVPLCDFIRADPCLCVCRLHIIPSSFFLLRFSPPFVYSFAPLLSSPRWHRRFPSKSSLAPHEGEGEAGGGEGKEPESNRFLNGHRNYFLPDSMRGERERERGGRSEGSWKERPWNLRPIRSDAISETE